MTESRLHSGVHLRVLNATEEMSESKVFFRVDSVLSLDQIARFDELNTEDREAHHCAPGLHKPNARDADRLCPLLCSHTDHLSARSYLEAMRPAAAKQFLELKRILCLNASKSSDDTSASTVLDAALVECSRQGLKRSATTGSECISRSVPFNQTLNVCPFYSL